MLISFEGIDGSGKSTQIDLLKKKLHSLGKTVQVFREPGGTKLSEEVRSILLNPASTINPVTELLLFSAARSQLVSDKIVPALEQGEIVILDRFYDSTTAYQGYGRESIELDKIRTMNSIASHGHAPDITFYLKLSLEESLARTAGQEKDRMETSGDIFFKKVIHGFDELSKHEERFITIQASRTEQEIHAEILKHLQKFL